MTDLVASQADALLNALLKRDVSSYSCGIVCNVAGVQFSVGSDVQQVIDNAMHYLFPSLTPRSDDQWTMSFDQLQDGDFSALRSALIPSTAVAVKAGFAYLRGSIGEFSVFASAEGFENDPHIVALSEHRALIVAPRTTEVISRLPTRVIREIGLRLRQNYGGCFVHAAAVSLAGSGVMIIGSSGAGKTTTLANLLRQPDARFVANDRGILSDTSEGIVFDAWPLGVRVGLGTVSGFPELSASYESLRRTENRLAHDKIALDASLAWGSRLKLEYTPLELCHRFDRHAVMTCTLRAVIFPHLSLGGAQMSLKRVSAPAAVSDVLHEEITEPIDAEYGTGWMGLRTISLEQAIENKRSMIDRLSVLPIFELVGDPRFPSKHAFSELTELRP